MKVIKKTAISLIAAALVLSAVSGCAAKKTAESEAPTAETVSETAEPAVEDPAAADPTAAAEPAAASDPAESSATAAPQEKTYEGKDGWQITYSPQTFSVSEDADGGVTFTYTGECTGTDAVTITYHPGRMPSEVLYDKTAEIPDERVTRSEGWFGGTYPAWTYSREIAPDEKAPDLDITYTGIEHNGGTLLVKIIYHRESDEELGETASDNINGLLDSFTLTDHAPQQEMAYKVGTYDREYREEIEGTEETFKDTITLNEDHTGTISFQDDIDIIWSSIELIERDSGAAYEYTVEGDMLMVNMNDGGEWLSFERRK